MRKFLLTTVSFALVMAGACSNASSTGPSSSGSSTASETSAPATAADCAEQNTDAFVEPGTLTIGTDNPAFPPYFAGGETDEHPDWKFNDPYTGKGFEDAVAYEVASRLGVTTDQVAWTVAPFNQKSLYTVIGRDRTKGT